jgi:uncharacterized damage-inducible protein DinB
VTYNSFAGNTRINAMKTIEKLNLIDLLLKEMAMEAETTRKMLSRVPVEKFGWKPHPKSMEMKTLAVHIAELPTWVSLALNTEELDFAKSDYKPTQVNSTQELLDLFERSYEEGRSRLEKATEEDLLPDWTLRTGDQIHSVMTKGEVVRHAFSQMVHHRAQLGVYLRLNNIPIPGSYGPSADEII